MTTLPILAGKAEPLPILAGKGAKHVQQGRNTTNTKLIITLISLFKVKTSHYKYEISYCVLWRVVF